MSYPANLLPTFPSDKYDIEPVGDGESDLYILQRGLPYLTAKKPKSRCRIDLPYDDGSTTRDRVDASFMGRGGLSIVKVTSAGTVPSPIATVVNGDLEVLDGSVTATITVQPDEILTMMQQDDNFAHVPPHQNVKAITMVRFYDDVGAAGNCVAECPHDVYRGYSGSIPQYIGSVPPVAPA